MQYIITIEKSENLLAGEFDSSKERFESAVHCAQTSISSALFDYAVTVECEVPKITISSVGSMPFSIDELKSQIKGSFCNSEGHVYPEFKSSLDVKQI